MGDVVMALVMAFIGLSVGDSWDFRLAAKNVADDREVYVGARALGGFIVLRDDKNYPYLRLTLSEAFPRVLVARQVFGTVDIDTREPAQARYERSDVCAVPAASVVGEAVVAWELAAAFLEKFGGDAVVDVERAVEAYAARIR